MGLVKSLLAILPCMPGVMKQTPMMLEFCIYTAIRWTHHSGFVTSVSITVPGGGLVSCPLKSWNMRVLILFLTTTTESLGLEGRERPAQQIITTYDIGYRERRAWTGGKWNSLGRLLARLYHVTASTCILIITYLQVATALLVAGPPLTLCIPGQTLFASTSSYSSKAACIV